ncbi:hypothetical protein [Sorangium cellulosum]|nr:hypothetical protein [Sorangium cellulosum]
MSPLENVSVHRTTRGPERQVRFRSSLGPLLLAALGAALTVSAAPRSAEASVFDSASRWPEDADGYVRIPVCVDPTSSAVQRADGAAGGLIHAPNPSLADVVTRVRAALQGSWERWSSVRFTGWESCDSLLPATRMTYVGVRIHPDAPNQSDSIGVYNKGGSVQFKPWGADFNRCIKYNWQTNPGWFAGKRWFCAAQPTVSVGNSCSSGWVECLPRCNPRPFQGEWWTCPTNPSTVTGQSCAAPWELCGY